MSTAHASFNAGDRITFRIPGAGNQRTLYYEGTVVETERLAVKGYRLEPLSQYGAHYDEDDNLLIPRNWDASLATQTNRCCNVHGRVLFEMTSRREHESQARRFFSCSEGGCSVGIWETAANSYPADQMTRAARKELFEAIRDNAGRLDPSERRRVIAEIESATPGGHLGHLNYAEAGSALSLLQAFLERHPRAAIVEDKTQEAPPGDRFETLDLLGVQESEFGSLMTIIRRTASARKSDPYNRYTYTINRWEFTRNEIRQLYGSGLRGDELTQAELAGVIMQVVGTAWNRPGASRLTESELGLASAVLAITATRKRAEQALREQQARDRSNVGPTLTAGGQVFHLNSFAVAPRPDWATRARVEMVNSWRPSWPEDSRSPGVKQETPEPPQEPDDRRVKRQIDLD